MVNPKTRGDQIMNWAFTKMVLNGEYNETPTG